MILEQLKYLVFEPRKALFGQLTLYFAGVAVALYFIVQFAGENLVAGANVVEVNGMFSRTELQPVSRWHPTRDNVVFLLFSLSIVVLLTIPITWVYRGTRRRRDIDQSIVETVLILPIIVVGIIMIVQNNLALAFSLAGLFAGVQFRSRLNEIADAHYLFASIGISLAAGVGAWHIAYVLALFFCFGVYTFWRVGYATDSGDRHTRLPGEKAHPKTDASDETPHTETREEPASDPDTTQKP